ncbi:MAG TPA: phosphoglucosamine mutase, partial [Candidatus Atribacteria bacterium]|nr:phosphoglucosamine mutase [Candidatus Atribacteria bacterium]
MGDEVMKKYFGTDGIRGVANTSFITPEGAVSLGKTFGYYILERSLPRRVVIGKDTRISGDFLEDGLASGLSSMGIEVYKIGVITTPGIAYLSKTLEVGGGVVISASHNPYYDNGIKFFTHEGFKLSDGEEEYLEHILDNHIYNSMVPHYKEIKRIYNREDLVEKYVSFLRANIDGLKLDNKIVIDTANGATYKIAEEIFSEIDNFKIINNTPDGLNINFESGSTHIDGLVKKMVEEDAFLGFAYDGDGDRFIAVFPDGQVIDGDLLLYIFSKVLKIEDIVVTLMSNIGLDVSLKKIGVNVVRIDKVGDKYVVEEMRKRNIRIGGEQSGHIVFLDRETTGDGVFTSLVLLNILRESKIEDL